MVVTIDFKHVFKHPLPLVAETHLTKYPNDKDKWVFKVETIERKIDLAKGLDYRRRWAFCENIIPNILRQVSLLNVKELILEEEAWLNIHSGHLKLKSRNITWANYASMSEESKFAHSADNPNWTVFEQHGKIDIHSLGPLTGLLEVFAGKIIKYGVHKTVRIMEELLSEKSGKSGFDS
ncbi:preli domain-containing protein 2 [Plakobranchus ocellatus]|uniref:Preli domain-containing protein 2 n=1 Tax=Plakobranchus ocellatus TaxID=259542 RepID=A0AAV4AA52_9GAST|nr:preli domain-containing protein 2 [Plakobranchus ocellatus]